MKADTPTTDLRSVANADMMGISLDPGDHALLAMLAMNGRDPITHTARVHRMMYISQVGGIRDRDFGPPNEAYDATPDYFSFENTTIGPKSSSITESLEKLVEFELVAEMERPTGNGCPVKEYEITDEGVEVLENAGVIRKKQFRTLKLVKSVYGDVQLSMVFDFTSNDFEFRELNGLF